MASIDTSSLVSCTINGTSVTLKSIDVGDDSLQQNGLIKTRGKIVAVGIVVPPVNAVVKISGEDKSLTNYEIPRTYRVLSSFANVFTGLTDIELGCKLTYLSDRKPPNKNPTSQEENGGVPEEVFRGGNIPISASYVFQQCLDALDITSDTIPLKNKFAILEFDLSQGYVETMAKLLESESFVGCLDEDEVLRIRSLDRSGGTGPVLTREDLLSVGPIGSGALPGEDVVVSYSSRRLKLPRPEEGKKRNWEEWFSVGPEIEVLDYELDASGNQVDFIFKYNEYTYGNATYDKLDRMTSKYEETTDENGVTVSSTFYSYVETDNAMVVTEQSSTAGPITKIFDGCNFAPEEFPTRASRPSQRTALQRTTVRSVNDTFNGYSQVSTQQLIPYIFTPMGKRVIGKLAPSATGERINALLAWAARLVQYGSTVEVRQGRDYNIKRRPSQEERNDAALRKSASAQSFSRFAWVYGNTESEAVTEFTIPYAPDDILGWAPIGGYYVTPSNVTNVVLRYGRTQNKLLLGNRQGMNIVVAPKSLPTMPFDVFYINLFGFTVEYRVNRLMWTGTAETGIVATCDAVLWGTVGVSPGTLISKAWVPLPPGTTTLPELPNYTPGDPPTQNVIRPPVPGSPYDRYPLILDSTYSLPIYRETVYSGGLIKLRGEYKEHRYPYVIRLTPGVFEIADNSIDVGVGGEPGAAYALNSGILAPILGDNSATTYDGWTRIIDASTDDDFVLFSGWPFLLTLDSVTYDQVYVGSNGYLTFGAGSDEYSGISFSFPALPKLLFGAGDRSYQRVYTRVEGDNVRVRWEGADGTSETPGASTRIVEIAFFPPQGRGQLIEVRTGIFALPGGVLGLATATTELASGTISANMSWVFEGNFAGTLWTLTSSSHVGPDGTAQVPSTSMTLTGFAPTIEGRRQVPSTPMVLTPFPPKVKGDPIPLLDEVPGALAGYSLRSLRAAYTGPVVRVRRNSDNAESDFTAIQVMDGTLVGWLGGSGGRVATLYDQAGSGYNMVQTNTSSQPVISYGGGLILESGIPSIQFENPSHFMGATVTGIDAATNLSVFVVNKPNAAAAANSITQRLFGIGDGGFNNAERGIGYSPSSFLSTTLAVMHSGASFSNNRAGRIGSTTYGRAANTWVKQSVFLLSTGLSIYVNGAEVTLDATANDTTISSNFSPAAAEPTGNRLWLGATGDGGNTTNQKISEFVVYPSSQLANRLDAEANITSYYG